MYCTDGHFIILITDHGCPKPELIEKMTDQQRADLHRMMTAHSGTYMFDGSRVVHRLEVGGTRYGRAPQTFVILNATVIG